MASQWLSAVYDSNSSSPTSSFPLNLQHDQERNSELQSDSLYENDHGHVLQTQPNHSQLFSQHPFSNTITPQHQRLRTPTIEQVAFHRDSHRFKTTGTMSTWGNGAGNESFAFGPTLSLPPMFESISISDSSSPAHTYPTGTTPMTMTDQEIFGSGYVSPPTSIITSKHTPASTSTPPSTPPRRYRPELIDFARPRQGKYRKGLEWKLPSLQAHPWSTEDDDDDSQIPEPDSPITYKQYHNMISRYCSPGRSRNSSLRVSSLRVKKQLQMGFPGLGNLGQGSSSTHAPWTEPRAKLAGKRKAGHEVDEPEDELAENENFEFGRKKKMTKRRHTDGPVLDIMSSKEIDRLQSRDMEWES